MHYNRDIFKTLSSIYDGASLRQSLISSIIDDRVLNTFVKYKSVMKGNSFLILFYNFCCHCFCSQLFVNKTRKATGFKSLQVNCRDINQVTSKYQMYFLDKTCKKRSKTEKVNIAIEFYIFEIV